MADCRPRPGPPHRPPACGQLHPGVERAFFIYHVRCNDACDGDAWNPVQLTVPVKVTDFAAALRATDITSGDQAVAKSPTPRARRDFEPEASPRLTLEDAPGRYVAMR